MAEQMDCSWIPLLETLQGIIAFSYCLLLVSTALTANWALIQIEVMLQLISDDLGIVSSFSLSGLLLNTRMNNEFKLSAVGRENSLLSGVFPAYCREFKLPAYRKKIFLGI